ncbi:hypothetical protein GCM10010269_01310 [Streptomyces humidus]|uniref:Uncharacterized protein n=1 Tax=Streptomyces humidus TaxID=52259 RepID=A0A918FQ96_9ACTN|nr:hypothetical protein [Streptomyces humidus]GGR66390.1 hypothetical protein GCM10010269_01310 [Streptomyces humidus]
MRSLLGLLAAILSLLLPPRGAHRAPGPSPFPDVPPQWPARAAGKRPLPADAVFVDGLPLVRPYLVALGHQLHAPAGAVA